MSEPPSWGDSTAWQYWVIDVVKRHEARAATTRTRSA